MACAWVAEKLVASGYFPETEETSGYIARWAGKSPEEARLGRSADYLRASGQEEDLEFVLSHIDDLSIVPALVDGELVQATTPARVDLSV